MTTDPSALRVLVQRLKDVLEPPLSDSRHDIAAAIVAGDLDCVVCARWPRVGGKVLSFAAFYERVFGVGLDGKPLPVKKEKARG